MIYGKKYGMQGHQPYKTMGQSYTHYAKRRLIEKNKRVYSVSFQTRVLQVMKRQVLSYSRNRLIPSESENSLSLRTGIVH